MESPAVSEGYSAARELLEQAEEEAAGIRSAADRYHRQRAQEAELLVAKARRLLAVAEQRAASIEAEAARHAADQAPPAERPATPPASPAPLPDPPAVVDLTEGTGRVGVGDRVVPTGIDRMLQSAISRAFDDSFHLGV